jgi:hypothetical protein
MSGTTNNSESITITKTVVGGIASLSITSNEGKDLFTTGPCGRDAVEQAFSTLKDATEGLITLLQEGSIGG